MLPYILIALVMFGFLIAIHEFGHFFTAKLLGVRVNEFAIGMGPKLLQKRKGETLYTLRTFPIGGFCAMEGEDGTSDDPHSFHNIIWWRKFIILIAGSFMNFLVGFIIIFFLFSQTETVRLPVITDFYDGFELSGENGLMVGDEILSIDGNAILRYSDISYFFDRSNGQTMDLELLRDGDVVTLDDLPMTPKEYSYNGQSVYLYGIIFGQTIELTPLLVIEQSCAQAVNYVRMIWYSLYDLVAGSVGVEDLSGPIGIVSIIGEVGASSETTEDAAFNILSFISFIAINLAVMNLLPIPALDGGRILFLIVGGIYTFFTKKTINPNYEGYVNGIFFLALIALMIFIAVQDVIKLVIS